MSDINIRIAKIKEQIIDTKIIREKLGLKDYDEIIDDFEVLITTIESQEQLIAHQGKGLLERRETIESLQQSFNKQVEGHRYTAGRYAEERAAHNLHVTELLEAEKIIQSQKQRGWIIEKDALIESQKEEIERLKSILERLPSKITLLDSWADTEELTFPLLDPTEDAQLEWFDEFIRRLDEHVKSCFDGELYEIEQQEGDK